MAVIKKMGLEKKMSANKKKVIRIIITFSIVTVAAPCEVSDMSNVVIY